MKKILTTALLFLAVTAQAVTYNQVQHGANVIKKSTTTFTNTWELRGNIELGIDTYTVTLDNVQKNVVLYGTGTVRATRLEGNGTAITSLTPSNMLAGSLPATVIASSIAVNSIYQGALQANTSNAVYNIVVASAIYSYNGGSGGGGAIDSFPVGTMISYVSTSTIPTDFLYCNGTAVSRTTYSALFAVVGTQFGVGDNSTTFNLPDMRGQFMRGLDNGRGYDADTNRVIGSTQTDTMQGHFHPALWYGAAGGVDFLGSAGAHTTNLPTGSPITDGTNGTPRTGPETRPENIAFAYIIKYRLSTSTTTAIYDSVGTFTATQSFTKTVTVSSNIVCSAIEISSPTVRSLYGNNIVSAWVTFQGTGTVTNKGSFNVLTIDDDGTGLYTIRFQTPFASSEYAVIATARVGAVHVYVEEVSRVSNAVQVRVIDENGSAVDSARVNVMCIGLQ